MAVACILTGIITIACGLLPRDAFPAFAVLCGLMAIPCSWFNAPTMTLAQRNVPEEKLGRVMGLMTAGFGLASPIGVALGGALAEGIGVAPFFVVDGLLCIIRRDAPPGDRSIATNRSCMRGRPLTMKPLADHEIARWPRSRPLATQSFIDHESYAENPRITHFLDIQAKKCVIRDFDTSPPPIQGRGA